MGKMVISMRRKVNLLECFFFKNWYFFVECEKKYVLFIRLYKV